MDIMFECVSPITDDIEWTLTYVGSPENPSSDQVLETILLGPVQVGVSKFVLQSNPPNISKIPTNDVLGMTAAILSASYRGEEFFRVGYFVHNYEDEGEDVNRHILDHCPTIKTRCIQWN